MSSFSISELAKFLHKPSGRADWERALQDAFIFSARVESFILQHPKSRDLSVSLRALRLYQRERLSITHQKLLVQPDTKAACLFFLQDLYPDQKPSWRKSQVVRAIPSFSKFLPDVALMPLAEAIILEVLSDALDLDLALRLFDAQGIKEGQVDPTLYAALFTSGAYDYRVHQINLIEDISRHLVAASQSPLVPTALKVMRLPSRLMGLSELQSFLEHGLEAFARVKDTKGFIDSLLTSERNELARLKDQNLS